MIETVEIRTCDMGHEKSRKGDTIHFSFDSVDYELELCPKDIVALEKLVSEYIPFARKIRPVKTASNNSHSLAKRPKLDREHSADIRAWAHSNGIAVNDRGRIPVNIVAQYDDTH